MYTWLCLIGPRNRHLIRYLELEVEDPAFLYHEGELQLGYEWHREKHRPAGQFLGKAFSLLSKGHSLQQIKFKFSCQDEFDGCMTDHLFHNGLDSMLLVELAKISGIQSLKISPAPESEEGLKALEELRARWRAPTTYWTGADYCHGHFV